MDGLLSLMAIKHPDAAGWNKKQPGGIGVVGKENQPAGDWIELRDY